VILRLALAATLVACPAAAAPTCAPQIWPPVARTIVPVEAGTLSALAKVGYFEARGDKSGDKSAFCSMVAVMWTVVNRLDAPERFGRSIRQIATRRDQFARLRFVDPSEPSWMLAVTAASMVLGGTIADVTNGSTYFFRSDMKPWPKWARSLNINATIGSHVFLSELD
jgi:spore germination cell wall hydrolase CwlJ-like protein